MIDPAELHAYELRRCHTQPTPLDRVQGEAPRPGRARRRRRVGRGRRVSDRLDG
ncbi:hypothetical protein GCM10023340_02920 [Nocardioides marinquilinus]|uniref:Uncharacterized protein n=1 Tax=Nocardioides marinquilinus TaxID=1210400 RepID=A0ABP9P5W2_9ACTN